MSRPALTFVSVAEHGLGPSADVLTAGYAGYWVPVVFTPASLLAMVRNDSVDPTLSCIAMSDAAPVGAALIARRGWTSRVASIAVVPSARRRGIARSIMEHLLAEAKTRRDRVMELEVIEQNVAAFTLYEELGFRRARRLVGHEGRAPAGSASVPSLEEIDVAELARFVSEHGLLDLPWQLSSATLLQLGPPHVALRCGPSCVLISDPGGPSISVRALVTETDARRRGHALSLLRALFARHPGKDWRVSAIWPEPIAGVFARAGLSPSALSQWHMRKALV